ncbi:MAG: DUF362 domain-containing protein [Acidimicrobiales bacterium]
MRCVGGCHCEASPDRASYPPPSARVLAAASTDGQALGWMLDGLDVPRSLSSVALKLNLCEYRMADSGATTSPAFVGDLVGALRARAPSLERIVLLEQDSSGTRAMDLYALLGFSDLAERAGLELFDPAGSEWRDVARIGELPVAVPELVFDVDLFVNVPKLKFHGKTAFTGALKNNFGLLRKKWKLPYHDRLCETIVASNVHLPRQLVIMDGTVSLSGRGPAYGVPSRTSVVLGSWDPVAADTAGAKLLGLPRFVVPHLGMARAAGLGSDEPVVTWRDGRPRGADLPRFDWARYVAANVLRRGA